MRGQKSEIPVNVVGSSKFGRYKKISDERTYNMYISDDWLVNYAGFKKELSVQQFDGEGRGFFNSIRDDILIAVINSSVYRISNSFSIKFIGNLETSNGFVSMAGNLADQIAIADGQDIYILNTQNDTLTKQSLTFLSTPIIPNYVSFHNTFFLIASNPVSDNPQNWYVARRNTDNTIEVTGTDQFVISTKPDNAIAVVPIPGRSDNVIVFGSAVSEIHTQVGGEANYRRIQSINIDYGCVSVSTIASGDKFVCWLSQNENNSPSIMVSDGGGATRLSTDGIDFLMQSLTRPDKSTAFFFRQDGHLFYQISFFDECDNLSLVYDFNTKLFYHLSDEKLNYHPAREVVFFKGETYFISLNDPNIYNMSTDLDTYKYSDDPLDEGETIPRIRVTKTVRKLDNLPFIANRFTFWLDQGNNNNFLRKNIDGPIPGLSCTGFVKYPGGDFIVTPSGDFVVTPDFICSKLPESPRVDLTISRDGSPSFSNTVSRNLNPQGHHANRIDWHRLGRANEITFQLRFIGRQRFVANNGFLEVIE